MKYAELMPKDIEELNENLMVLDSSLSYLKDNIEVLREDMGKCMVDHQLAVLAYNNKLESARSSLFTLIAEQEKESKKYTALAKQLDERRFNTFRDDRGNSVASLPVGPLAIVPLNNSGVTPSQSAKWDDVDSPHAKDKPKGLIDFKECDHRIYNGPFTMKHGTYTCTNCNLSELACFECKKEAK